MRSTLTRFVLLVVWLCAPPPGRLARAAGQSPAEGAATPDPAPMTAANRTAGIAPLSVFFDCVDTLPEGISTPFSWASGVHQPADGDYEGMTYEWDFGDPGSGAWTTTGLSRNAATGYTAAHVYETPGDYTARLTVTDKTGAVRTYAQTIRVAEFSGQTYYVSADGSDANDGLTPETPLLTTTKGLTAVGTNRRILFRRGDTFHVSSVQIVAEGPGIIGAYGSGKRPVLASDITKSAVFTIRGSDWRIMDIELPGAGAGSSAIQYDASRSNVNTLLLRVSAPRWRVGLGWAAGLATPHDGSTMMECEVEAAEVNGVYVGGRRLAILGNHIHDIATSHVLRVWQAHKGVISNNRLWNPGPTRHALKLHGPSHTKGWPETRWVTITDNLIRGKAWSVAIGPQDGGQDERLSHIVFERNRTWGEASVAVDLEIWARHVMVRNNVFDGTGSGKSYRPVAVWQRGIEPAPEDVRVLNNTMVRLDDAKSFQCLKVEPAARGVTLRNNLASAPRAATRGLVSGTAGPGFAEDHNLVAAPSAFADAASGDFRLRPGSPAVDAGIALGEVRADFLGAARPAGASHDLGAYELARADRGHAKKRANGTRGAGQR